MKKNKSNSQKTNATKSVKGKKAPSNKKKSVISKPTKSAESQKGQKKVVAKTDNKVKTTTSAKTSTASKPAQAKTTSPKTDNKVKKSVVNVKPSKTVKAVVQDVDANGELIPLKKDPAIDNPSAPLAFRQIEVPISLKKEKTSKTPQSKKTPKEYLVEAAYHFGGGLFGRKNDEPFLCKGLGGKRYAA